MKEHFNDEFPVILKTSTGSQTGVGVLIMESMRSLNSTVQMLKLKDDVMPLLVQEYIKTDHDVRVIILDGEVKAVMKREVIQGDDFRSNVSLGAGSDEYELTDLEREDSIKAANAVVLEKTFTTPELIWLLILLLSPPKRVSPQVTIEPSALSAAKARKLEKTWLTPS